MTEEHKLLPVTQEDREAAKSLLGRDDAGPSWWSIDSGNADNDPLVQAFARHRLATRPIPSIEAGLADLREELATHPLNGSFSNGTLADYFEGIRAALEKAGILTALRNSPSPDREGVVAGLPDDEATSLRIIDTAWREAGISARPFFGEAYEPGTIIRSIVRQVTALANTPQAGPTEAGEGSGATELARLLSEFTEWPDSELVQLCLAPVPGEHDGETVVAATLGQLRRAALRTPAGVVGGDVE